MLKRHRATAFPANAYVKFILRKRYCGRCPSKLRKLLFQSAHSSAASLLTIARAQKVLHQPPSLKASLEYGFTWRKGDFVANGYSSVNHSCRPALQGSNPIRRGSLENTILLRRGACSRFSRQIHLLTANLFHSLPAQLSSVRTSSTFTMPFSSMLYIFVPFHVRLSVHSVPIMQHAPWLE